MCFNSHSQGFPKRVWLFNRFDCTPWTKQLRVYTGLNQSWWYIWNFDKLGVSPKTTILLLEKLSDACFDKEVVQGLPMLLASGHLELCYLVANPGRSWGHWRLLKQEVWKRTLQNFVEAHIKTICVLWHLYNFVHICRMNRGAASLATNICSFWDVLRRKWANESMFSGWLTNICYRHY